MLEIMTEGTMTVKPSGSSESEQLTITFGIGTVVKSNELLDLIKTISILPIEEKEKSKLRDIFRSRNKESQVSKKSKKEEKQLAITAPEPEAPKEETEDQEFQNAVEDFFGTEEDLKKPDERDLELAKAAAIFDGKIVANSGEDMGVEGVKLLISRAMEVTDMSFDEAKEAVKDMLTGSFQVVYDMENGTVTGLDEDKYLNALGRIQKKAKASKK